MGYQHKVLIKKLILALLVLSYFIFTIQQESCTLPDGKRQSTCIRFHYCDGLVTIYKQYNGKPPPNIAQNLNAHACGNGLYCCPDNAVSNLTNLPERPADLNAVRRHRNFNLINEPKCGITKLSRLEVYGGDNADVIEFPWAVLLGYQENNSIKWRCGGSLISKQFVLTAAHCLKSELTTVRLGEHTISTSRDCDDFNSCADPVQDIKIQRTIMHQLYSTNDWINKNKNDIALLKLESPADITKNNVKTICLPTIEDVDIDQIKLTNRPLVISGWGITETGSPADILQKANVPYIENSDCVAKFSPQPAIKIYHTFLCAGGDSLVKKTDNCKGDSGGGISRYALFNGESRMILYGVVSGGVDCKYVDFKYPGIYTNTKYYLDWILDNISQ